jgi:hypothetical protein
VLTAELSTLLINEVRIEIAMLKYLCALKGASMAAVGAAASSFAR